MGQAHVRCLAIVVAPTPLTSRSEETTVHRCDEDAARYRKGISRRLSAPQIVFGRHQRHRETLRGGFLPNFAPAVLTEFIPAKQGCRRKARGPRPMVDQVEGRRDGNQCRR